MAPVKMTITDLVGPPASMTAGVNIPIGRK